MKTIPLTKGLVALVDDEDFEFLSQFNWYANTKGYAMRDVRKNNVRKAIFMHHVLCPVPKGMFVDHENQNKQDYRRCNLRPATATQNRANTRKQKNNTTGFKRVHFNKQYLRYQANIACNGKQRHLGFFDTPEEASAAYEAAAKIAFGKFASA